MTKPQGWKEITVLWFTEYILSTERISLFRMFLSIVLPFLVTFAH